MIQYYEVMVRYEKFFLVEPSYISQVMVMKYISGVPAPSSRSVCVCVFVGDLSRCKWYKTSKQFFEKPAFLSACEIYQSSEVCCCWLTNQICSSSSLSLGTSLEVLRIKFWRIYVKFC